MQLGPQPRQYLVLERSRFRKKRLISFQARVVLKMVSLTGSLVACSARIAADRQTDRQTHTQNDYRNPRCACAPRVNNSNFVVHGFLALHFLCFLYVSYDSIIHGTRGALSFLLGKIVVSWVSLICCFSLAFLYTSLVIHA